MVDESPRSLRVSFRDIANPASDEEFAAAVNTLMPEGLKLMGAHVIEARRQAGELRMRFRVDARFGNVVGFVSGGYLAQMLDQTAAYAATLATGRAAPTTNLAVSLIAAARPGDFVCRGRVRRAGGSLAFLDAELFDEGGRLVATASVTSQLVSRARLVDRADNG